MRKTVSLLLALELLSLPAQAQQPMRESAKKLAGAAAGDQAPGRPDTGHRATFWTGAAMSVAGATAIILGTTVIKSGKTTSGNTPVGAYQSCIALKANPVYRGNECDDLRGFDNAVLFGGITAAAAGITLMMLGSSRSNIEFGPRGISVRHRVTF